jgi:DNA-binding CsgD family transcriptional regulator
VIDQLALLVLALALAAGLVTITVSAVLAQTRRVAFFRAFQANILLFNLLVLLGLAVRYSVLHLGEPGSRLALTVTALMSVLKVGWLYAFALMCRALVGEESGHAFARRFLQAAAVLFAVFAVFLIVAAATEGTAPARAGLGLVEVVVLGGVVVAAARLACRSRALPSGPRRRSLAVFGYLHLALFLVIALSLITAWTLGGERAAPLTLLNSSLMIAYNGLPLFWIFRYLPPEAASIADGPDRYGLTEREREVVELIRAGKTNQEIAGELFISVATVKDHNYNIFRKTGVRNRVELTNLFRESGNNPPARPDEA